MGGALKVGIVGAGKISGQYSAALARLPQVEVTAVADLDAARAAALASQHPGARAVPLAQLLGADDVELVLNLTIPAAHADVALAALEAGKDVYGEKPLAATTAQGRAVVDAAAAAGRRLGCAPDTVLGTGLQTARAVVDSGAIGRPLAATAFMTTPGHERWHPDPEFYYRPGGGPLLDMGPYHLSALVHLLGPVRRVVGAASRPRATRTIGDGPRAGTEFAVEVDTHVSAVLEHHGGALTTMVMSFDVEAAHLPSIEVHGEAGSLSVPDPNCFDGAVELFTREVPRWVAQPVRAGYLGAGRGYGVADLAAARAAGRPHRASADLALHVLDVMEAVAASAASGAAVVLSTTCERPAPVPGSLDLATGADPTTTTTAGQRAGAA
ncbi:MAG: oxidoreductase domain protein [uncultured Quadrisphaera sp.]|uniref:Oxidoreductase domain protein n=1 Tax=uncultured Quadrisphaera sp. TaxID=904978 RepID=A0A6J4QE68_9ACTN|nr:MAG: oxidoreductase domain protein [uncultured Quadrisphaera sp.]